MRDTKRAVGDALPFAMEPVVYDFAINERGTRADLLRRRRDALMPPAITRSLCRRCCARDSRSLAARRAELDRFARCLPRSAGLRRHGAQTSSITCCRARRAATRGRPDACSAAAKLTASIRVQHEQIQADLRAGRIGLAQNRLPRTTDRGCARR